MELIYGISWSLCSLVDPSSRSTAYCCSAGITLMLASECVDGSGDSTLAITLCSGSVTESSSSGDRAECASVSTVSFPCLELAGPYPAAFLTRVSSEKRLGTMKSSEPSVVDRKVANSFTACSHSEALAGSPTLTYASIILKRESANISGNEDLDWCVWLEACVHNRFEASETYHEPLASISL